MKPILYNTPMVQAILGNRKTATRRIIKGADPSWRLIETFYESVRKGKVYTKDIDGLWAKFARSGPGYTMCHAPYLPGDILYVRETWGFDKNNWIYKADFSDTDLEKIKSITRWRPSIHMPKEAARIFLRVTDVRAERLKEITDDGARKEGIGEFFVGMGESGFAVSHDSKTFYEGPIGAFVELWDSTVTPEKREIYGWAANPWAWVIEFERCEKPKEE